MLDVLAYLEACGNARSRLRQIRVDLRDFVDMMRAIGRYESHALAGDKVLDSIDEMGIGATRLVEAVRRWGSGGEGLLPGPRETLHHL